MPAVVVASVMNAGCNTMIVMNLNERRAALNGVSHDA